MDSNGATGATLKHICSKTESTLGLIRRIANRHRGIEEENLIWIIHAFILCHLAYSAVMHNRLVTERKINFLIRRIFQLAFGLPIRTRTADLKLEIHNTFEEISEAQEFSQLVTLRNPTDVSKGEENKDTFWEFSDTTAETPTAAPAASEAALPVRRYPVRNRRAPDRYTPS
ncbi:hypothetical protein HPB50_006967 [Hyalomma asiaticum]|uniref:Uncharacterized protein n=1 Tax=Hyalomma asiaticum TaxID=266040 RepID=A0ACB7TD26_HYAAI|nr:hypothetical protein HPB50_006967 [Hyalomma asiaticum]